MRIISVNATSYSTGTITVSLDNGDALSINMTDDESERIKQVAVEVFFSRQKAIAKEIETARPQMIELQPTPVRDSTDDIPF